MASKQSDELVDLFKRLCGAIAANPNMPMREMRAMMEHVGGATAEPDNPETIADLCSEMRFLPRIFACRSSQYQTAAHQNRDRQPR